MNKMHTDPAITLVMFYLVCSRTGLGHWKSRRTWHIANESDKLRFWHAFL